MSYKSIHFTGLHQTKICNFWVLSMRDLHEHREHWFPYNSMQIIPRKAEYALCVQSSTKNSPQLCNCKIVLKSVFVCSILHVSQRRLCMRKFCLQSQSEYWKSLTFKCWKLVQWMNFPDFRPWQKVHYSDCHMTRISYTENPVFIYGSGFWMSSIQIVT